MFLCLFVCLYYNRNTYTVPQNLFIKLPTYIVSMIADSLVIIINIPHRKQMHFMKVFQKMSNKHTREYGKGQSRIGRPETRPALDNKQRTKINKTKNTTQKTNKDEGHGPHKKNWR